MASDTGNKITNNDVASALDSYEKEKIKKLTELTESRNELAEVYRKSAEQLSSMKRSDPNFKAMQEQTIKYEQALNGIEREHERFVDTLNANLRESIVSASEQEVAQNKIARALSEETKAQIAQKKKYIKELDNLEKVLGKLQQDLYTTDENDKEKQEQIKAQIARVESQIEKTENAKQEIEVKIGESSASALDQTPKKMGVAESAQAISSAGIGGEIGNFFSTAAGAMATPGHESLTGKSLNKLGNFLGHFGLVGKLLGKVAKTTASIADAAIACRKILEKWVDSAANVLSQNVGKINAALEGTGNTYKNSVEKAVESLGVNRYVKQTDYLNQIASLTATGITYNVEQRALLETIKDKTIASFSSMEGSLLRLVRLKQTDITANTFGLEAALRNTLNKVFKDSTYMPMFDQMQSAITDAIMMSGQKDIIEYSSVIQTWMGAMYESGVESGTVSKIANALNALGSGNVSALASDTDMQRLILLSMDTIGMDFADILQQGLSSSDINDLLTAVVKYLTQIESNTKNNNVLTSSYTNLFGMSTSDIKAIKNLNQNMSKLEFVDKSSSLQMAKHELDVFQSTQRNIAAEQIENAIANATYAAGAEIANSSTKYLTWKTSNLILDIYDTMQAAAQSSKTEVPKFVEAAARGAEPMVIAETLDSVWSIAKGLPAIFELGGGDLTSYVSAPSYGGGGSASGSGKSSSVGASIGNAIKGAFKTTWEAISSLASVKAAKAEVSGYDWENPKKQEDELLTKITELDKLKVANEAGNQAWAVFLTGMTDDTLRSFASIFADENAMNDTFSGNNNVLKDNLFNYADKSTSNSKDSKTTSTTGTKTTATTAATNNKKS